MPGGEASEAKEKNLFKELTADIDSGVQKRKQDQFDALTDEIDRIFMGDIRNFYADDFPNACPPSEQ